MSQNHSASDKSGLLARFKESLICGDLDELLLPAQRWSGPDLEGLRKRLSPVRMTAHYPASILDTSPDDFYAEDKEHDLRCSAPSWLEGTYRPKSLTRAGLDALEKLGPGGGGFLGIPHEEPETLADRRQMLAARYVAWDMVARGLAVESAGLYRHVSNDKGLSSDFGLLERQLSLGITEDGMDPWHLVAHLAMMRLATLDQILALDPSNAGNNLRTLRELQGQVFATQRIPFGRGALEVWSLTRKAWTLLQSHHPHLKDWGWGPFRRLKPYDPSILTSCTYGMRALHPLLVGDAIAWFRHGMAMCGSRMTDVWHDRALAVEAKQVGERAYMDLRLFYEHPSGVRGCMELEVIGIGGRYRSKAHKAWVHKSPVHASYSSSAARIDLGRHVCIGR